MGRPDDQIATLNQHLQQLGFTTMGDHARALTEGVVGSRQLVEELADTLASKLVVKVTTNATPATDATLAMKSVRSPVHEPSLVQIPIGDG